MERSSTTGIKKKPTFTPLEIRTMLEFIQQTKIVLMENGTPPAQAAIKLRSCVDWCGLAVLLSGMGVAERTDVEVRKKFENLLFETKKKFRFRLAGVHTQSEWTEVHEIALELLGRENMMAQIANEPDLKLDSETKPVNGFQFVNTDLNESALTGNELQTELINPDYAEHDREMENGNNEDQLADNEEEDRESKQVSRNGDDHSNSQLTPNDAQHHVAMPNLIDQSDGHLSSTPSTKRSKLATGEAATNASALTVRASPLKMTLRNRLTKSGSGSNFRFSAGNSNAGANATANFNSHVRNSSPNSLIRVATSTSSVPSLRARHARNLTPNSHRRFISAHAHAHVEPKRSLKSSLKSRLNGVAGGSASRSPTDPTATELPRSPRLDSDWLAEEHAAKMRVRFLKEQKLTMQIRILKLQETLLRKRLTESDLHSQAAHPHAADSEADGACVLEDADATSTDLVDMRVRV